MRYRSSPFTASGWTRDYRHVGCSTSTCLSTALKDAVRWRLVSHNVADAVTPPRLTKPEITPLTAEQVKVLLAESRGDRLEGLYILAVTTGMRIGEMFGLSWSDLDLEAGTLQVRRTVAADGAINPPKTT